ncbi:hypothetical protein C9374_013991 [Naegleria lovaniensis]|uniref:Uncharacterized protein n=1 Tax=Naegleria lovaniensis TaxID=51637 RepID=A0AA88GVX7_NAELO|nr:uncharacterized protein C9374_013991 [Naegleria lovaniensis]KAG2389431.1 hypothetical protein C9374_013991 [Naegleria lovaniensis]
MPFTSLRQIFSGCLTLFSTGGPTLYGQITFAVIGAYSVNVAYKGIKNVYLKVSDRLEEAEKLNKEKLSITQAVTPYRFPTARPPMMNAPFLEQQAKKMILQQQQNKSPSE